ncbi:MaoC family dehydratase [Salinibaculum rarum]|uniref:MaoC family dehydratase n=1 Tax=Salinibaculum rarum TaxID=3058903 RepID=UPI00265E1EE7|nr:MaoC family dehydratase [Salinibaculum sp. KK48]
MSVDDDSEVSDGSRWSPAAYVRRSTEHAARSSAHFMSAFVEASRAATPGVVDDVAEQARIAAGKLKDSIAYSQPDWDTTRSIENFSDLAVGEWVEFSKTISEGDVTAFAECSGDTNRLHLDDEFGAETQFDGRIVHGTLVSGVMSAALARFPGVSIYVSQEMEFVGPVKPGERVTARCEIEQELGDGMYQLSTRVCDESGAEVITGEAVVLFQPPE